MTTYTGSIINGYAIGDPIGKGGHGIVYEATHVERGDVVAVKVLQPEYLNDDKLRQRLENEAQMVRDLQHPRIVHCEDSWHDERGLWLVMRYLRGGNLREFIAAHKPIALDRVGRIVTDIAEALHAAHQAGIVHRDIKPDNIVFDEDGTAYLTDFGIAKRIGYQSITSYGVVVGSPAYLTPEQLLGHPVTPATDIYAFGITVYEMLVGDHPFTEAKGQVQLMIMLAQMEMPAVHEKRPDVPETISRLIRQATVRDPGDRFASARLFARFFHEAAGLV